MTVQEPLAPFDTAALNSLASSRPDIASRLLCGILLQIVGTGAPTFAEYIEYVRVKANNKEKLYLVPGVQAAYDAFLNSNGDTLDTTFLYIPFIRPLHAWSRWGTRDISSLEVICKIAAANPNGKTLTKIQGWLCYVPVDNPENRGDIFVQTVIPSGVPVAGWNTVATANLPIGDIVSLSRLLLNSTEVSEVRLWVGSTLVYHMTDEAAYEACARNPMYKLPANPAVFPVFPDVLGLPGDFVPLVDASGVRRPVKLEYYHAAQNYNQFDILIEGVERGTPAAVANAKA